MKPSISTFSNREILDRFKAKHGINSDSDLARFLGVTRQQVYQFAQSHGNLISHKMLSLLLESKNT